MKTLFERLKPEYKAKLNDLLDCYPNVIKAVIDELHKEYSILDIRYGTAMSLQMYLNLESAGLTETLNLFEDNENIIN